jgi:preprotein translocase SecE subunit
MNTELEKSEKEVEKKSENTEKISSKSEKKPTGSLSSWWKDTKQFLYEVWVEIRPQTGRVTWPTYENVKNYTKVVIISSILLGFFIGLCDMIFTYGLDKILNSQSTPGMG